MQTMAKKQIDWEKVAERAYERARKYVYHKERGYLGMPWNERPRFVQRAWIKAIQFSVTQINKEN